MQSLQNRLNPAENLVKIEEENPSTKVIKQKISIYKQLLEKDISTKQYVSASQLKQKFAYMEPLLLHKTVIKKRAKATNIPKFLLKVFNNNLPDQLSQAHRQRVRQFFEGLSNSKTRFDLLKLFGKHNDKEVDRQNELNRNILKRLLNRNFDNILKNKHIRNKKLYLLFCKKVILRLSSPDVIDRLEV